MSDTVFFDKSIDLFTMCNNLVIAGRIECDSGMSIKEVAITDGIYCSNVYCTGDLFNVEVPKDFVVANTMFYTQHSNLITMSNDLTVKGRFECGNLTIQGFEQSQKITLQAKSNLVDFFDVENGLRCPGAYFTPQENVFTSPTYFLHDIYLSSNLKIDPVFNVTVQANKDFMIKGRLIGHEDTGTMLRMESR